MIYESAVVIHPEHAEKGVAKVNKVITEVLANVQGEVILEEDWGMRTFPQVRAGSLEKGQFLYFMFKATPESLKELARRLSITEEVVNRIVVKLGPESKLAEYKKNYVNPFKASETEAAPGKSDVKKDRRMFARKKNCWFTANKTRPDWKDPSTYTWLINEFGKISPSRVTGISRKMQNLATEAIKRGRNIGLISYMSGDSAR